MISSPGQRPPYPGTAAGYPHAPNAALLIDFDNVTMGIRSDLGKELKSLLNSEVIRGKVAVQRAYADWRRYPQYIVPLAESSIDLIFAPAYGSSKKNATDLRMAIDAIELVFTRPEIGTFILMTGDSDFSSCVLKLKEYGKYVIGVGMRESSSDLLIQNCDEYYSYHSLSGLTRTGEVQESKEDPWVLMKRAAQQMEANGDVMRTDRLKQVMLDLDPAFDEKKIGYSKFSRFVQEAATKGVVRLRKGENGQFEIMTGEVQEPAEAATSEPASTSSTSSSDGRRGRGRDRDRDGRRDGRRDSRSRRDEEPVSTSAPAPQPIEESAAPAARKEEPATEETPVVAAPSGDNGIDQAYRLLQAALRDLVGGGSKSVRDGDVKRRMLDLSPGFDESDLGFAKFTRFLRQAHDAEVVDLQRSSGGNYEVALPASGKRLPAPATTAATASAAAPAGKSAEPARAEVKEEEAPKQEAAATKADDTASRGAAPVGALRGRRGGRAGAPSGPPPILPGQAVSRAAASKQEAAVEAEPAAEAPTTATQETAPAEETQTGEEKKKSRRGRRGRGRGKEAEAAVEATAKEAAPAEEPQAEPKPERSKPTPPPEGPIDKITARARRGRALRGDADERATAPPILPGQAVKVPAAAAAAEPAATGAAESSAPEAAESKPARRGRRGRGAKAVAEPTPSKSNADATTMPAGLPTGREAIVAHLSGYKGVGVKSAEGLYDAFGESTFEVLRNERERVSEVLGPRRSATVLAQWEADYADRISAQAVTAEAAPAAEAPAAKKPASRGRGRGGGRGGAKKATAEAAKTEKQAEQPAEEAPKPKRTRSSGGRGGRGRGSSKSKPSS